MTTKQLRVAHISPTVEGGGAEQVVRTLHEQMLARGIGSSLLVGHGKAMAEGAVRIPDPGADSLSAKMMGASARMLEPIGRWSRPFARVAAAVGSARSPRHLWDRYRGREYFGYPGTKLVPRLLRPRPDVLHCHNLHGDFFDLRALGPLSHRLPVVLTLHDEWLLTGHCAYSFACERWRGGCGACPDLTIYPAIHRDGSAANWRAKRAIYHRSRLHVSTPSRWLMDRAQASMLAEGAVSWRVIPNGVDRRVFHPGDQRAARSLLGLPEGRPIVLFAANRVSSNAFKDYTTVAAAVRRIGASPGAERPVLVALGAREGEAPGLDVRLVPFESDRIRVAAYYRAADAYLHAARADNMPMTILEALACGTPVVATAVGGIPEEIISLAGAPGAWSGPAESVERATGVLVAPMDADAMASAAAAIVSNPALRSCLSANASADAAAQFDVVRQVDETIAWYREIIAAWRLA